MTIDQAHTEDAMNTLIITGLLICGLWACWVLLALEGEW